MIHTFYHEIVDDWYWWIMVTLQQINIDPAIFWEGLEDEFPLKKMLSYDMFKVYVMIQSNSEVHFQITTQIYSWLVDEL